MKLSIGQKVTGVYWNKGFNRQGRRFKDGVVIGFTQVGSPIIEVCSGNLRFKVYRVKVDD